MREHRLSTASEIAGNHAAAHTFTHDGKTYTLRLVDDRLNVEWERKQLARARDFESGNKPMLSREEFAERLDKLSEKYHAGHFSLFGWLVMNADTFKQVKAGASLGRELTENMILLSSLIFGCEPMEMTKLLAERGAEVLTLVRLIVRESMPVANRAEDAETNVTTSATGHPAPNA